MVTRSLIVTQAALLLVAGPALAQQKFELILPTAPGVSDIEDGRIDEGIARLEKSREVAHLKETVGITLCAAYVMNKDFERAETFCDRAVHANPPLGNTWFGSNSDAAYNNRGVLRALQGDLESAVSDFRQARHQQDGYIPRGGYAQSEEPNDNLQLAEQMLAATRQEQEQRQAAVTN